MQSQSHRQKVIITLRSLWGKEVPYDTKFVNAIKAFYCAISMLEKFKTPVTIEILTLMISIVPFWKQNIVKVPKDMVIRNGEMKHNLSVPYDYVWGINFCNSHCLVTFAITKSIHMKWLFLQIFTRAKTLIMEKAPRGVIAVEFCYGGLRAASCWSFWCFSLFLRIIISWEIRMLEGHMFLVFVYHRGVLLC